jgi:16S rRNA pseudouridine516 synthase
VKGDGKVRIDKFLSVTKTATRSEAAKAAKQGRITVNGTPIKDCSAHINENTDVICFDGQAVVYKQFVYIMMNKPSGILSASTDKKAKTVVDLLPYPYNSMGLFPCGRLDKDTVGLIILTNDGELSHKLLSPKKHAEKLYAFELIRPYDRTKGIEKGIMMDGKLTKPAVIEMESETRGRITLTEGKYHQIKRMFEYASSEVTFLERLSFGGVELDSSLERGQWRPLTEKEEEILKSNAI